MDPAIAAIGISSGWLPATVDALAVLLLVIGLVRRPRRRPVLMTLAAAALGVALGLTLCWLLSDRLDLFDVSLSPISRAWVAAAFGGVGVAIASAVRRGRGRRVVAILAVPVVLLAGAIGVNADFGQYPTIGSLRGSAVAPPLSDAVLAAQRAGAPGTGASAAPLEALWRRAAPADRPARGVVGTVAIPATRSHFPARRAYIYLPPAALVPHPIDLPVLILLAGQPGGPSNMVQSGRVRAVMDAFAAQHDGFAPIVVVPDQLTAPQLNPMCVDSALGNAATYLTVDVPDWIRTHLTVETSPTAWAIGGFSEGGTCSIQFGSAHPELFRSIIDISGEKAPADGSVAQTIERGFHGSTAAYTAALPLTLLAEHAPYSDTVAVFASGQLDTRYGLESDAVSAAARAAGMHVTRAISPGTSHDWHTVQWTLSTQLTPIYRHLGLEAPA